MLFVGYVDCAKINGLFVACKGTSRDVDPVGSAFSSRGSASWVIDSAVFFSPGLCLSFGVTIHCHPCVGKGGAVGRTFGTGVGATIKGLTTRMD